jgi:6-pyruvoyltetrahydropterin/6-carboxytetrahydropterin synthase
MKKYFSTKSFGVAMNGGGNYTIAYRQWRDDGHCRLIHGYSMAFEFRFESMSLDARNWVVDFGSLGSFKRDVLDEHFDHTLLVAGDDPQLAEFQHLREVGLCKLVEVERTGAEGIADFLYGYVNDIWLPDNYPPNEDRVVRLAEVRVWETPSNSAGVSSTGPGDRYLK